MLMSTPECSYLLISAYDCSRIEQMESSQNFTIDLLPQNKQEPPELAAKDIGRQCKVTKPGFCSTHNTQCRSFMVTSKKWGNKGTNKGYGWISRKTKKWICRREKFEPEAPPISSKEITHHGL